MKNASMKNIPILGSVLLCLMLVAGCATTGGDGKTASVMDEVPVITSMQIEDNNLVIRSNKPFVYTMYNADPYRASIEIPNIMLGEFNSKIIADRAGISEVIPLQVNPSSPAAKIEIVLQNPSTVTPVYRDNALFVEVAKMETTATASEPVKAPETKETARVEEPAPVTEEKAPSVKVVEVQQEQPAMAKATEIKGIEIKKTGDSLKVMITGNGTLIPNVFPVNERIVVDIPDVTLNTVLPEKGVHPLKGIRAGKHKDKLRLVLDLKEKTNFDVTAVGNAIEISLTGKEKAAAMPVAYETPKEKTAAPAEAPAATAPASEPVKEKTPVVAADSSFTGKKISLDFQDADIVPIFRLLTEIGGYNSVIHPDVKGKITLKLINVPWDQAMQIILKTFQLGASIDGNVIRIAPGNVMEKEFDEALKAKKAASEFGDMKTRIFPVNYADLTKLQAAIDKAKVLSSRGSVTVDERGSTLIVNDLESNLAQIEALIKELDQEYMQARQVMIEAKIVEVNVDYVKELGIQWGMFFRSPSAPGDNNYWIGSTSAASANVPSVVTNPINPGNTYPATNPLSVLTRSAAPFLVNLPVTGAPGSIGFGYLARSAAFALDITLTALEQDRKGKVLSNPKVMTMNNQEAKITQGRTIYLPVATSDKIDYKAIDALLSLTVKPRIAPGGAIFMDLDITKDEPGAPTAGGVDVLKNTVKTNVLVNNSDTVVIGGIFKQSTISTQDGIPYLSKLPLLGNLFKKNRDTETNSEVLIFITPTVVEFKNLK
ncbi:MAG: type IV pilus secretin PilQ [Thermodesulfovibrionales bacterium]